MKSIYDLKSAFQNLLRPIVRRLAKSNITANQVTLAALLLSLASGLCIALFPHLHWPWLMVPAVMFVRMALNAIDGMLAREHNMQSKLGAILNEISDVVSDTALYLPFMFAAAPYGWMVAVVVSLAIISEMMGVVAVQIGASRRYDGPMGKSDRAFVFSCAALVIGLGVAPAPWFAWLMAVMIALLAYTIINRAKSALKECHG